MKQQDFFSKKIPHIEISSLNEASDLKNNLIKIGVKYLEDIMQYDNDYFLSLSEISTVDALRIIEFKRRVIKKYLPINEISDKFDNIKKNDHKKNIISETQYVDLKTIIKKHLTPSAIDVLENLEIKNLSNLMDFEDDSFFNKPYIATIDALKIISLKQEIKKFLKKYSINQEDLLVPIKYELETKSTQTYPPKENLSETISYNNTNLPLDNSSYNKSLDIDNISQPTDTTNIYTNKATIKNYPHINIELLSLCLSKTAYDFLLSINISNTQCFEYLDENFFLSYPNLKKKVAKEIIKFRSYLKNKYDLGEFIDVNVPIDFLLDLSHISINNLYLTERSNNALLNVNIDSINKLFSLSKNRLLNINALGKKSAEEIINSFYEWIMATCKEHFVSFKSITDSYSSTQLNFLNHVTQKLSLFLNITENEIINYSKKNNLLLEDEDCSRLSTDVFLKRLIDTEDFLPKIKDFWLRISNKSEVTEQRLIEDLLSNLKNKENEDIIKKFVSYCEESNIVKKIGNTFIVNRICVKQYFQDIEKKGATDKNIQIVLDRLNEKTLQEVGESYNLTRERIRQITAKTLKNIPPVFEDYFSQVYEFFHCNRNEFESIFPFLDKTAFTYISTKYKKGVCQINEHNVNKFSGQWKNLLKNFLSKQTIKEVSSNYTKFIYYILKQHSEKSLSVEELLNETRKELYRFPFLEEKELKNEEIRIKRFRTLKNVVFDKEGKIRYCKINYEELLNKVNFSSYNDKVISANLIYNDYSELMEDLDIRDGYELYYVLKYSQNEFSKYIKINFRRVPTIIFGSNASEESQSIDLLNEISPVNLTEFCEAYEERFGVRRDVVPGNKTIIEAISPYYSQGQYIVSLSPSFNEEDTKSLIKILSKKEFWFIDDIKKQLRIHLPHIQGKQINRQSFFKIGYILNKGYLFNKKYSSITNYFEQIYFSKDVINSDLIDAGIKSLSAFISHFSRKRIAFDYLEDSSGIFYSINKIEEIYHITKKDLFQIQKILSPIVHKYCFFNGDSIWTEAIQLDPIINKLNNNKFLLTSILRQSKQYLSQRIGGNIILYEAEKINEKVSLETICRWALSEFHCNSINELQNRIEDYFNCKLNNNKLVAIIQNTDSLNDIMKNSITEYIDKLRQSVEDNSDDLFEEEFF